MAQDFSKYEDYLNLLNQPNLSKVEPEPIPPDEKYKGLLDQLEILKNNPVDSKGYLPNTLVANPQPKQNVPSDPTFDPQGGILGAVAGATAAQDAIEPSSQMEQPKVPEVKPLDFSGEQIGTKENLQDAFQKQNQLNLIANLGRSFDTIGQSIAGVKREENPVYGAIEKQAANIPKQQEMLIENQKNDPNSPLSRGLKDYLETKLNTPVRGNPSAADIERVLPLVYKDYEARLAEKGKLEQVRVMSQERSKDKEEERKFRAEQRALDRTAAGEKQETKGKEKLSTETRLIRREIFSGPGAKTYGNFQNAERAQKSIEKFMNNPTGYSDYATLLGGLKALQGDESVVRETEIKLGMDAGSFGDRILNRIEQLKSGKSLQPSQRKAIMDAVSVLRDVTKDQFLRTIEPQLTQAEELGIPKAQLIPKGMIEKTEERSQQAISPENTRVVNGVQYKKVQGGWQKVK